MTLTSEAFQDGALIPRRYTCDGENISPVLRWAGVPSAAAELALIVEDPDAPGGSFVHWVLYGIPPAATAVAEGEIPAGAVEGTNGFGHSGWGGPCPPKGDRPHRYVFHLSALSKPLGLAPGSTAAQLRSAMSGLVVAEGTLTGRYGR